MQNRLIAKIGKTHSEIVTLPVSMIRPGDIIWGGDDAYYQVTGRMVEGGHHIRIAAVDERGRWSTMRFSNKYYLRVAQVLR